MSDSGSIFLNEYSDGTKVVCLCIIISFILILIFIISPISNFLVSSILGKIAILLLLGFSLYKNFAITFSFSKNVSFLDGSWSSLKTNILLSYVFSLCIIILIFSVLNRLLR